MPSALLPRPGVRRQFSPVGQTANVQVLVDPSLGSAGLMLAQRCLSVVEDDYQWLQALFGVTLPQATMVVEALSQAHDGTGGAYHNTCADAVCHCDADLVHADGQQRTSALFIAELSEVGQAVQGAGWDCGATNGEGLSRVHAEARYPGALDDFESASAWLDGGRPNWVDANEGTDTDYVSNGCAVLCINWLQFIGYTLTQITQAGGTSLASTYHNLSGKTTAWADFTSAASAKWPPGRSSGVTTDNPWGPVPPTPPAKKPATGPITTAIDAIFAGVEQVTSPVQKIELKALNYVIDLILAGR